MSNKNNNIPDWVIKYNKAGHQSSAGKAVAILIGEVERLKKSNDEMSKVIVETKWFVEELIGESHSISIGQDLTKL